MDFTVANVVLLPLITIVDGYRRGIARPWLFFASTLFLSFTAGWALYLLTIEHQRRLAGGQLPAGSSRTAATSG